MADIDALAREIQDAQDRAAQIPTLTGRHAGFGLPEAYAVAGRVCEHRRAQGWRTVGRKIGFTNASLWPTYGVHLPIWGWMYERSVVMCPRGQASLSLASFAEPKIEPEIVFGLRSVATPAADDATLLDSIEWVAHGFEIVQSHFAGWKFQAPDTVADGGLHGALLLGERCPLQRFGSDAAAVLASFSITLRRDGADVETGSGANVLGSPLAALRHLLALLAAEPANQALAAGEIVTTGTLTGAYPVAAGEVWSTELAGCPLPGLSLRFKK